MRTIHSPPFICFCWKNSSVTCVHWSLHRPLISVVPFGFGLLLSSLSFDPLFPFSVSNGISQAQHSSGLSTSHMINADLPFSQYGPFSDCDVRWNFPSVSSVSSFFFNRLTTPLTPLLFQSLEVLQCIGTASVMPLALLLCVSSEGSYFLLVATLSNSGVHVSSVFGLFRHVSLVYIHLSFPRHLRYSREI